MRRLSDVLDTVRTWEGLSGRHHSLEVRSETARLILPHDGLAWALSYLYNPAPSGVITSICGLVGEQYLRELGVSHRLLSVPYATRIGLAVSDLIQVCRDHGAWQDYYDRGAAPVPERGDVVMIGRGGAEHILIVQHVNLVHATISSTDGGQRDNSWILPRERRYYQENGRSYLEDPERSGDDKIITGIGDIRRLAAVAGVQP